MKHTALEYQIKYELQKESRKSQTEEEMKRLILQNFSYITSADHFDLESCCWIRTVHFRQTLSKKILNTMCALSY